MTSLYPGYYDKAGIKEWTADILEVIAEKSSAAWDYLVKMAEKKPCVLVVDDHLQVLRFVEIDLKHRGYAVVTASSGEKALELVKSVNPDIMLVDIIMPGINGFTVLKELRTFTKLPVIAFSASPENQDEALRLGANDFMPKPFDLDDMQRRITALLQCPN
jgi:two-component system, OmpR family, KDP operon response regulator KdpE